MQYSFGLEEDRSANASDETRVPVISRNLDTMTRCMEKVLDKVLEMDAETDAQLDMKMKYMDMVENYMNNLSVMMAKLL